MFQNIVKLLGGAPNKREIEKMADILEEINGMEASYEQLSDEALRVKSQEFRDRLADGETLDDILPEAFAAVREAGKRTLGMRHYDVQMIGGITLQRGKIAEMRTGEGKTLVATLPLYLNALTGRGVHLVTVNDYLARRDARWMAPIYHALGLSVGVLQMAARTDNGKKAFIVDLEKVSSQEDQHNLRLVLRKEAYQADITYGTNSEFGFDYLRDNLTMSLDDRVQRGHYYAIVDEVDNILIDEARTPLIISGPASENTEWYQKLAQVVRQLQPEDYEVAEKDRQVTLTEIGEMHVEELLGTPLRDPERPEDITPEQARILGFLEQALRAQHLYRRNKDYIVQAGKVIIVDEFTGRLMPGRRWSEGLHQAVEAKEGVKIEPESVTYATITLQNYFRMYEKLAGMTGTAATEAEEFHKIYKLDVLPIPTNLEYQAAQKESDLVEISVKNEPGYTFTSYARRDDPTQTPIFWKRKDYIDQVYRSQESKLRAITQEIVYYHVMGRPLLVGTTSVEHSENLSNRLQAENIRRLLQILAMRQVWMEKNNVPIIDRPIPELQSLYVSLEKLGPAEIRPVARIFGLSLNMEDPENLKILLRALNLHEHAAQGLVRVIQGGVPHQVLNARKHDEESQIIARAGAFGSVTIATNMAGRGVDIKLGGELSEEILRDTNRVLGKSEQDPYDMTNEERLAALKSIPPDQYGIYEDSVKAFIRYMEESKRVRELGGLHVIGSERHEARRIDNQLRGRAGRQGDPGSSRFYLSLEDELMRLFGGQQVEALWKRIFFDESQPIELRMLGRLVEQSQERVEGANFDVRKHLIEYDDVLNAQRQRIYSQRDRVFTKEDLSEDILDMLRSEMQPRIPNSLKDPEGPWKLLAYLEEIQPPFEFENIHFPSFILRLLQDEVRRDAQKSGLSKESLRKALLQLAGNVLEAEREHLLRSIQTLLERSSETHERQRTELLDTLSTFMEGLEEGDEEEKQPVRPAEALNQLSALLRLPLKLSPEMLRVFPDGDRQALDEIRRQVNEQLMALNLARLFLTVERRLEEPLGIRPAQLVELTWAEISRQLTEQVEDIYEKRIQRLLGDDGEINRSLDPLLARAEGDLLESRFLVQLLVAMTRGTRMVFDARTHRKTARQISRLKYHYQAARLIEDSAPQEITERVLSHLEEGLVALQQIRGRWEWLRLVQGVVKLEQLDERLKRQISAEIGPERFSEIMEASPDVLAAEEQKIIQEILGKRVQNEMYRQLLLRVISEQWVEYLTQVEALRVSIGLEAYAQRDPLVQYKGRASEMFKNLLVDIRVAVISRVFTYQPRRVVASAERGTAPEEAVEEVEVTESPQIEKGVEDSTEKDGSSRRKRHHRKR